MTNEQETIEVPLEKFAFWQAQMAHASERAENDDEFDGEMVHQAFEEMYDELEANSTSGTTPCPQCGTTEKGAVLPMWIDGPGDIPHDPPQFFSCSECFSVVTFEEFVGHPRYVYDGETTWIENYEATVPTGRKEADL